MSDPDLIQLDHVCKRFGGVTALDGVNLGIRRGEVHALVGENGAGKSTLMKLLAGVHAPDSGEVRLNGQVVRLNNPRDARRQGISIVFQELNLFPHRSVTANIFAGRESIGRLGLVRRRAMQEAAQRVFQSMDVSLDPNAIVGELTIGSQQLVEIARALEQDSQIIILDEPNSALTEADSRRLFAMMRELRTRGITVLYVSHRLDEVFAIADRITVIRDGRHQGTYATSQTSIPQIITAMIGRQMNQAFPPRPAPANAAPLRLELRDVCVARRVGPISFDVCGGEILGFAGLEGAGIDDLFQAVFGLKRFTSGQIHCDGERVALRSAGQAIRLGWGLIPASRRDQGLLMGWSIARNIALTVLDAGHTRWGLVDQRAVQATAEQFIERLGIAAASSKMDVAQLSGGNQQKVLLAKWLAIRPKLMILNDPTRGVDVGAKQEIYQLCRQLAAEGVAILFTSSEADEMLGLVDRVLVLRQGRPAEELRPREITKAQLIHAMSATA